MNRERRNTLHGLIERLESVQTEIEEIKDSLDTITGEEQDAYDNLPESIQNDERGQEMQAYIDSMESTSGALEDLDIESIIETLREIAE